MANALENILNMKRQGEPAYADNYDMFGEDPYGVDESLNVFGPAAQIPGQYDQAFIDDLFGNLDRTSSLIPDAPQMDLSGVPQPQAERMDYGYDPATLAQMRAGASEGASRAGIQELSQVRQQLERSGLGSSPAGAAVAGDVARRTGVAQNDALRNVDISNAQMQMQNQQTGLAAANAMALANANRLFDAMNTNIAAQQQQIGAKTNLVGQFGGQLNSAQLGKQANADTANAQTQENRWQTGVNALSGMANDNPGSFQPTQSTTGNVLGSIGSSMLDGGLQDIFGPQQPVQPKQTIDPSIFGGTDPRLTDQMGY